jgi:hypothetical protein
MMPHDLDEARKLAKLLFSQLFEDLNKREQAKIAPYIAARGMSNTGKYGAAIIDVRKQKVRDLIDGKIKINRDLCTRFPELCSAAALSEMMGEFSSMIENAFTSTRQRFPDAASITRLDDAREDIQLKAYASSQIEILKTEVRLNIHRGDAPPAPGISVTVSGGNAVINLGTVYGNVQQAISDVQQHGYQELAASIEQLARAINDSQELGQKRKMYLEQVEFIAKQTAESEEVRKKTGSAVAGIFSGFQLTLQAVANAAQILSVLGPELAKHFGLPWPL